MRWCGVVRRHHHSPASAMQPAGQDPEALLTPGTVAVPLCSRTNASPFWIILLLVWGGWSMEYWFRNRRAVSSGGRFSSGFPARSVLDPLVVASRRRHSSLHAIESPPTHAGSLSAVADQKSHRGPAHRTSVQPSATVASAADKSSPRYALPKDLSNALQQLDDLELDRLVAASRLELRRRGRPETSTPEIQLAPTQCR